MPGLLSLAVMLGGSGGGGARPCAAGERGRGVWGAEPGDPGRRRERTLGRLGFRSGPSQGTRVVAPAPGDPPGVPTVRAILRRPSIVSESGALCEEGFWGNCRFRRKCLLSCAGSALSCTVVHKARSRPAHGAPKSGGGSRGLTWGIPVSTRRSGRSPSTWTMAELLAAL
jgi:hypothetical protein